MYLYMWKKICCFEEVIFVAVKKVLHFWRWENKKNIQVSRDGGYTHRRLYLLWWKDTGTPYFVKPTLLWVSTASFRYCCHICSQPPLFLRLDQIVSLMFRLLDITDNLVLNEKEALDKNKLGKASRRSRFFLSGKVSDCFFVFINILFTDRVISTTFFTGVFCQLLKSRLKSFSPWK